MDRKDRKNKSKQDAVYETVEDLLHPMMNNCDANNCDDINTRADCHFNNNDPNELNNNINNNGNTHCHNGECLRQNRYQAAEISMPVAGRNRQQTHVNSAPGLLRELFKNQPNYTELSKHRQGGDQFDTRHGCYPHEIGLHQTDLPSNLRHHQLKVHLEYPPPAPPLPSIATQNRKVKSVPKRANSKSINSQPYLKLNTSKQLPCRPVPSPSRLDSRCDIHCQQDRCHDVYQGPANRGKDMSCSCEKFRNACPQRGVPCCSNSCGTLDIRNMPRRVVENACQGSGSDEWCDTCNCCTDSENKDCQCCTPAGANERLCRECTTLPGGSSSFSNCSENCCNEGDSFGCFGDECCSPPFIPPHGERCPEFISSIGPSRRPDAQFNVPCEGCCCVPDQNVSVDRMGCSCCAPHPCPQTAEVAPTWRWSAKLLGGSEGEVEAFKKKKLASMKK